MTHELREPAAAVRRFLRRSKDGAVAFAARMAANIKLRWIGEMTELSIDTKRKKARVQIELIGEATPIQIEIVKYSLKNKGNAPQLTIEEANASREWLTVALREFVVGKTFAIPANASAALKLLT